MAIAMTTQRVEVGTNKSTPVERYTLQPDLGQPSADHGDFSPHLQSRPCEEHRRAQPRQPGTERLGKRVSFVAVEGWKVLKEGGGNLKCMDTCPQKQHLVTLKLAGNMHGSTNNRLQPPKIGLVRRARAVTTGGPLDGQSWYVHS